MAFNGFAVNMNFLYERVVGVESKIAATLFRMRLPVKAAVLGLNPIVGVADRDVLPATRILDHLQFVVGKTRPSIDSKREQQQWTAADQHTNRTHAQV